MKPAKTRASSSSGAFTLVELLVVIGIIALLISILLPALSRARKQANAAKCMSNLRQIVTSFTMYCNDHKGVIVNPVEYDKSFSPTTVFWHQRLSYYMNKRSTRGSTPGANQLSGALRGCPEFDGAYNTGGAESTDKIGYGMARRLRTPESRTRYHMPYNAAITETSPQGINGPIGDDAKPTAPLVYYPPPWKITQLKRSSGRIIFGDSWNTFLDPPAAGWDLTASAFNAQSGDIGRHSSVRSVTKKEDPGYKKMRANYAFVDGHVETLPPDEALAYLNGTK